MTARISAALAIVGVLALAGSVGLFIISDGVTTVTGWISGPTATVAPTVTPQPTATPAPVPTATPVPVPTAPPTAGNWQAFTRVDPVNDQWRGGVGLVSDDGQARLYIRCTPLPNLVIWEVYIGWGRYLDNEDTVIVWQRYGTEPAFNSRWNLGVSNRTTFAPRGVVAGERGIISQLEASDRYVVRVARYDGSTITAEWQVQGLTTALRPLMAQCDQRASG